MYASVKKSTVPLVFFAFEIENLSIEQSEFQFDQVFSSEISNKQVFECTVLPFLSSNPRHNLTYICFGQTGSGL